MCNMFTVQRSFMIYPTKLFVLNLPLLNGNKSASALWRAFLSLSKSSAWQNLVETSQSSHLGDRFKSLTCRLYLMKQLKYRLLTIFVLLVTKITKTISFLFYKTTISMRAKGFRLLFQNIFVTLFPSSLKENNNNRSENFTCQSSNKKMKPQNFNILRPLIEN